MPLVAAQTELNQSLDLLAQRISDFSATKQNVGASNNFTLDDECFLEGLLSRLWQVWGRFCRKCVVHSCMGATTVAGAVIPGVAGAATEGHVSAAAIRARNSQRPNWQSTNSVLRFEPTWGDTDVLARIIPLLAPSNANQMLAAFSVGHPSAKALQTIRNGASHDNPETRAEILALAPNYLAFPITHPTHAMFWTHPQTQDFLVLQAIQDLKGSALASIS